MLSRKHRFLFKSKLPSKVFNSHSFSVRYDKNDWGLRVAVIVSKKVDKRATVRNKIKRKILQAISKNLKMETQLSFVFYIKKYALSSKDLSKEIEQALEKIRGFI